MNQLPTFLFWQSYCAWTSKSSAQHRGEGDPWSRLRVFLFELSRVAYVCFGSSRVVSPVPVVPRALLSSAVQEALHWWKRRENGVTDIPTACMSFDRLDILTYRDLTHQELSSDPSRHRLSEHPYIVPRRGFPCCRISVCVSRRRVVGTDRTDPEQARSQKEGKDQLSTEDAPSRTGECTFGERGGRIVVT